MAADKRPKTKVPSDPKNRLLSDPFTYIAAGVVCLRTKSCGGGGRLTTGILSHYTLHRRISKWVGESSGFIHLEISISRFSKPDQPICP